MKKLFFICISILVSMQTMNAQNIQRFTIYQTSFEASKVLPNPYTSQNATAEILCPDGTKRLLPLFWDGGKTFTLRFSPDIIGEWSYKISSNDNGLKGKTGKFICIPSNKKGSIRARKDYPRHFERQDGTPFWFLGDTQWLLFTDDSTEKFNRQAAEKYINTRKKQGFNVVHTMLLAESGDGNINGAPWEDLSKEKINPAYWQEVDKRIEYANSKDIILGLALGWGFKSESSTEKYSWDSFPSLEAKKRYARYIAARYGAYNIYFLTSGEWQGNLRKLDKDAREKRIAELKNDIIEIGNELKKYNAHNRMIGVHPFPLNNGSVGEFNTLTNWMDFGDYQQTYDSLHASALNSFVYNKPVVNSEYGYFLRDWNGDGIPDKENSTDIDIMRHSTWDILTTGAYVVTGFGTTYFSGKRDPGFFNVDDPKNKIWEQQMTLSKSFFTNLKYWKMQSQDHLVKCIEPRGKDRRVLKNTRATPELTYWCLAEPNKQYILYVRGTTEKVELNLEGLTNKLEAKQWNPRHGEYIPLEFSLTNGIFTYTPPDHQDWIVLLTNNCD